MTLGKEVPTVESLKSVLIYKERRLCQLLVVVGNKLNVGASKTYRKEAVLVSTTTKIGFPQRQLYMIILYEPF